MFRKVLIIAMSMAAAGYCFAADSVPQVVTSEVFYTQNYDVNDMVETREVENVAMVERAIPAWPIAGSDADVEFGCGDGMCAGGKNDDNIRIVSKIGADLIVENNFDIGARGEFTGWSGGANMLHGNQIPVGFDDECASGYEMPLLRREVMEDDGGEIISVSRSGRKVCNNYTDGYSAYMAQMGMSKKTARMLNGNIIAEEENEMGGVENDEQEIAVNVSADAEAPVKLMDQVRSWVVANGQTLRAVLQTWCDKEGWDLVWTTSREYPIEASAVFKGRFVDVASALVRNFERATPIPYAKFYKGNRVLVIYTTEE